MKVKLRANLGTSDQHRLRIGASERDEGVYLEGDELDVTDEQAHALTQQMQCAVVVDRKAVVREPDKPAVKIEDDNFARTRREGSKK